VCAPFVVVSPRPGIKKVVIMDGVLHTPCTKMRKIDGVLYNTPMDVFAAVANRWSFCLRPPRKAAPRKVAKMGVAAVGEAAPKPGRYCPFLAQRHIALCPCRCPPHPRAAPNTKAITKEATPSLPKRAERFPLAAPPHTHWCLPPLAHESPSGLARPLAKDALLYNTTAPPHCDGEPPLRGDS
jgi:hypothetical protein